MSLPTLALNQEALSRFGEATKKEWLITNGLGGYASSTILGINTRKYHGLLVAALHPPGDRTVCVSKLDEDVIVGEQVIQLGSNEFQDSIYPQGYKQLKQFSVAPYPTHAYAFDGMELTKTVFMPKNKNVTAVIYKFSNKNSVESKLRIYPILTCRYFHTVTNQSKNPLSFTQKSQGKESEISFQNPQTIILLRSTDGAFNEKVNWINRLFYRMEATRGEESIDDCFQPGYFEIPVQANEVKELAICAAASSENITYAEALDLIGKSINEVKTSFDREIADRNSLLQGFYELHPEVPMSDWLDWILLAADSFVVSNAAGGKAVIAGYHWFESWGRDTFISLPGLLLVTGRFSDAKNILQTYNQYCKNGLIPNYVRDKSGEPAYNTVDATLWYVNAVLQYLKYTGDFTFVKEKLWENLQDIVNQHEKGTLFGIRLDDDGLLSHGPRLTWMDAEANGKAVTPRAGKAVEIQALWYNALKIMELLANKFDEKSLAQKYASMANRTSQSFNVKFWNPGLNCLFDVIGDSGADASLRPNQILAVSLDYTMLDQAKSEHAVNFVNRELVTHHGLRTLSLNDPKFNGKCVGDRATRDEAYHNGTIWPWLLGPFMTAYLKTKAYDNVAKEHVFRKILLPFFDVGIRQEGLGTITEIYDCDLPNIPRGCISQAWSVAEPLRAYVEDVLLVKPKFSV